MNGSTWTTSRVEAFSDGVFAIAITLLVLEIQIPQSEFSDLWQALGHEWPAYLAYATSFLTVGAVWIAHHNLFSRLRFVDPAMMRLNMLLLLVAAFLPFPTGLLAEAFDVSRDSERAAVVVYGATALAIELVLRMMWRYAISHSELMEDGAKTPPHFAHGKRAVITSGLYAVAIVAGVLILPRLAAVGYLLVAARGVFTTGGTAQLRLSTVVRRSG